MNNVFVFILCIIGIVTTAEIVKTYLKREKKPQASDADPDEMIETIDMLEKRIQVLERIVTQKNVDLKQRIDEL
jgi:high-affinity nickel permease